YSTTTQPPDSLAPYTTPFRSLETHIDEPGDGVRIALLRQDGNDPSPASGQAEQQQDQEREERHHRALEERRPRMQRAQLDGHGRSESTRLNSSHQIISYAVFC